MLFYSSSFWLILPSCLIGQKVYNKNSKIKSLLRISVGFCPQAGYYHAYILYLQLQIIRKNKQKSQIIASEYQNDDHFFVWLLLWLPNMLCPRTWSSFRTSDMRGICCDNYNMILFVIIAVISARSVFGLALNRWIHD